DHDLRSYPGKEKIREWYQKQYGTSAATANQYSSQLWAFLKKMKINDLVVLPSKRNWTIHVGIIKSDCLYNPDNPDVYRHYREVDWVSVDVPRSSFDQDLLYSFGAFSTICQIQRNNAEERIRNLMKNQWKNATLTPRETELPLNEDSEVEGETDIELFSMELIARFIERRFKGYEMQALIGGILEAKGYKTYIPERGADQGVDILAGKGEMGFDQPKICVQVKVTDTPVDRPTVDQLVGAMVNHKADFGLFVSWRGFKSSVEALKQQKFFSIRFWDQKKIIEELFETYDKLSDELRNAIPLKRIWTLTIE
ncbi:MAG TPA: restriction endonuclease, partial [Bacillota bacterium]|nr:restriction endonuclease [Bacillota bacterium]